MFEHVEWGSVGSSAAVAGLSSAIDELLDVDLAGLTAVELVGHLRDIETERRRLAAVDHALIAELDDRRVAAELCVTSTAGLLVQVIRVTAAEARARVRAAANLGPRRGLTGAALPPLFEQVAAAQAAGAISVDHARVIVDAVDRLPMAVQAEHEAAVEASLVQHAATLDPARLAVAAARIHAYLDPDGRLADDADHQRGRDLAMSRNRDGSYHLVGRLTPECGAMWEPVFDSLARPVPAEDGQPDARRPGQRLHDAFEQIPRLLDCAKLPEVGGLPVMLILTATADDAAAGTGVAVTGHGGLIPTRKAVELASEGSTVAVLFDPRGGVLDYGQARRIVPKQMRLALVARDRGCTFPGCDRPAAWTQAHHFREFASGGATSVANTGLVCGYHHREFARRGWRGRMINGLPHWIPPSWLDPAQTPRRNTVHDPPLKM